MHLLIIITDYGSFNNFLSELAISMVRAGHQVDVICSGEKVIRIDDKFDYKLYNIRFHFISLPRGFNLHKQFVTSLEINRVIKSVSPDIIHVHFTTGIFTTLLAKKPNFLTIGTIHGLGSPMLKGRNKLIFRLVEHFCIKRLDQVILLNKFDYDLISQRSPKKAAMLDTHGLGCDLERFNPDRFVSKHDEIRASLKIRQSDFVITYTGRFVSFKGFDLVIRSFLKLNKLYPNTYKLLLIGGIDSIHPCGLNEAEQSAYEACPEIIKVGFIKDVERHLSITDLFLFPSLKEGMPVCIIEALAMGIPTIAANSRGCNDLIVNNKNGVLLSESPTMEEVIETISGLKNSPGLLDDMKAYALQNRFEFSRDIFINKQIDMYHGLISESNKKAS